MADSPSIYTAAVEELVAIGAAIACNCEAGLKHHFCEAIRHGVARGDIALAIATARTIKDQVATHMQKVAGEQLAAAQQAAPPPGSCHCSG